MDWNSSRGGRGSGRRAALVAGALLIAQGLGQGSASAAVRVPCNVTALITAINTANDSAYPQTLYLAPSCTYTLTAPAASGTRGNDGLPIISGSITMVGNRTTIRRSSTKLFRIFEVTRWLALRGITILGGDAGANTGGGILSAHGTVWINSTTISSNVADNGAGISNDRGTVSLSGSVVRCNSTRPRSGGGGGGIYNDGRLSVTSGSVINNRANTSGGGIYNELGGTLAFYNSNLNGNEATLKGGGLFNGLGGTASFSGSTVQFNVAGLAGGGIYNANFKRSVTLRQTAISFNEPTDCEPTGNVHGCPSDGPGSATSTDGGNDSQPQ
jgi:hypothetical protein